LRTKQNPADAAKLQHNYKLQAHGMTLAVLEAQRKFDEVEREKRILDKCLSRTTMVAGTQMNTMMEVGAREDQVLDTSESFKEIKTRRSQRKRTREMRRTVQMLCLTTRICILSTRGSLRPRDGRLTWGTMGSGDENLKIG
jgi:hypothetical protein